MNRGWMSKERQIRTWFQERFNRKPENDPSYFDQWEYRFAGVEEGDIPYHMDYESRRAWGNVTGQKYAKIIFPYGAEELVDLKTGEVDGTVLRTECTSAIKDLLNLDLSNEMRNTLRDAKKNIFDKCEGL